jgi:hypothetical protein
MKTGKIPKTPLAPAGAVGVPGGTDGAPGVAPPDTAEERRLAASTVTLRFDERGEPLPAMDETVERAREWLKKSAGPEPEVEPLVGSGAALVDEKLVGHVLHGVNIVQAGLVRAFTGLEFDRALEVVRFSDKEVTELAPAAIPVLEKHLPAWLGACQDLAGLIVILGAIETAKLERLRALERESEKEVS